MASSRVDGWEAEGVGVDEETRPIERVEASVDEPGQRQRIARGSQTNIPTHAVEHGLEQTLTAMVDACLVVDVEGRIASMNRAAERLTGYMRHELIGCAIDQLGRGLADGGRVADVVASVRTKRGVEVEVELLYCPGTDGSRVLVLRPPAPREGRLDHETIACVAHDLKTPLSTIMLELVAVRTLLGGTRQDIHRAVTRIEQNVACAERMVQDLLDAAMIEDDRLELRRAPVDLRALAAEVRARLVPSRDQHRVHLQAEEPIVLWLDGPRVERVLANLLGNALKYAPRTSEIVVRVERQRGRACVSVDDRGCGLTPEQATTIFDKYRRLASAQRRDGVGLGLYICRRIIEAHGGRIGVESVPECGSRFFFELPME